MPWWVYAGIVIAMAMLAGVVLICLPDKWPRNRRDK